MAERVLVQACARCGERTPHGRFHRSPAPALGWLAASVFALVLDPMGLLFLLFLVCAPAHAGIVLLRNAAARVGCLRCASRDEIARRRASYGHALREGRATFDVI